MKKEIQIAGCIGKYCHQLAVGHYPTPFMKPLFAWYFSQYMDSEKKFRIQVLCRFSILFLNGLERFFIEKIRVNNRMEFLGFHPTQAEVISTLLVGSGILIWILLYRKSRNVLK